MADKKKSNQKSRVYDVPVTSDLTGVVDGIRLRRAQEEQLREIDRQLRAQAAGTNIGFDQRRYIPSNSEIFPYENSLDAYGFVIESKPNRVYMSAQPSAPVGLEAYSGVKTLDPNMQEALNRTVTKKGIGTLAHEMTHVKQRDNFLTPQEYEKYRQTIDNLARRYENATALQSEPKYGYLNPFHGSGTSPNELGAYLSQYEAIHPTAKTVSGTNQVMPIERSYLGDKILPKELGLRGLIDAIMGNTRNADPEKLKLVRKLMGQERKE